MSIAFGPERWARVHKTYEAFWQGTLDRPVVSVLVRDRQSGRPCPSAPMLSQQMVLDFSIPVEAIVDRIEYELSTYTFLGDAFPWVNMDAFGPGAIAAMCGAEPKASSTGNIWFEAPERDIQDLHIQLDTSSPYCQRICEVYEAMLRRFQGQVLLTMVDLGGTMDLVATLRGSQNLLFDLYDEPEEVLRLREEAHAAWWQAYQFFNGLLQPVNPGYSDWSRMLYTQPGYILQCDFSYMVGPEMYRTFMLDEIRRSTERLEQCIFHLDGVGELPHLDMLLDLPRLGGIQWIPGDGQPPQRAWPQVYHKIIAAGKRAQMLGGPLDMDAALALPGQQRGNLMHNDIVVEAQDKESMLRNLARWGVEA